MSKKKTRQAKKVKAGIYDLAPFKTGRLAWVNEDSFVVNGNFRVAWIAHGMIGAYNGQQLIRSLFAMRIADVPAEASPRDYQAVLRKVAKDVQGLDV